MIIKESCKDWSSEYNNPSMPELDRETTEYAILSSVLHLAGDVLAAYNNIPKDIPQEFKELLLDSLAGILTETKVDIVECIDSAVSMHALTIPLDKGYSEEEVFGVSLTDQFKTLLAPDELKVAAEHFHALQDQAWVDGEEDDDNGLV